MRHGEYIGSDRSSEIEPLSARGLDLGIALTVALSAVGVAVALANQGLEHRYAAAGAALAGIALPAGAGLYAWRRAVAPRFGRLLVATGLAWFATTLANSGSEPLYSLGRISAWGVQVLLIYVLLAYPSGRLTSAAARAVVGASVALVALLFLPTVFVAQSFPVPSPWSTCVSGCPGNAFAVTSPDPGFLDGLVAVREAVAMALFLAAAAILTLRVRQATPLTRTTLTPVLGAAVGLLVLEAGLVVMRRADAGHDFVTASSFAVGLISPLLATGFFVGLVRWRLRTAGALEAISARITPGDDLAGLESTLAGAFGDPALRVLVPTTGSPSDGWHAVNGNSRPDPLAPGRRAFEVMGADGRPIALLVCDEALRQESPLLKAAIGSIRATLERRRLDQALHASLREVAASRARIAAAGDLERRRIERDIHDGAQQRLIALQIRLALADEAAATDTARAREILQSLTAEVGDVIDEVRSLAHGIYPALLTDAGPVEALRGAVLDSPIPVRIRAGTVHRHTPEVESTIYFCCLEAIQNAVRHARASEVEVRIEEDWSLRFSVSDDGDGLPPGRSSAGSGLTNMRDRLAALDGELSVESEPGEGTYVRGVIPFPRGASRAGATAR